jgi:hypothetical protein
MVAYHSFGSQRAPVAMLQAYPRPRPDDPVAAAAARTWSGWAIATGSSPGRVYDHTCAIPLPERAAPEATEVWLGEFGDTVVYMVPSDVENQRRNRNVGADRPVRAELVDDERATVAYVDRAAGIDRFVEIGPEATRGTVRGAARGAPLPFEQPFLDGTDHEVFPRSEYLRAARMWLFAVGYPRGPVPPAAMVVRGYHLGPVDGPLPLADGRPVVELPPPDKLAGLLAGAELLDERDGRHVAGGGDWFQLHRVDADHALLVGCDVEDTETFFGAAVSWSGAEDETDLLAGVPEWWAGLVRTRHAGAFATGTGFDPVTIVCGWDGGGRTKAIGAPDPVLLYHFLDPDDT